MKSPWLYAMFILAQLAAACAAEPPAAPTATSTTTEIVPTAFSTATVEFVLTDTPAPTPTNAPRTLTICTGDEPNSLYIHGDQSYTSNSILEAIYDGPIDSVGYSYQPVILEKLPSLADGDAVIRPVTIEPGEILIDAADQVSTLHEGLTYRPAGCRSGDCAQTYSGSDPVIVDQMTVTFTLKAGITWSDGQELTTSDSVYSFGLDSDPDTPTSKYETERTESYTADGQLSVVWIGKPGFIDRTYFLNFWHPLPHHLWKDYTALELVEAEIAWEKPVGWGPYVIDEWVIGSHIALSRNPYYFRAEEGLPHFDRLVFRIIGENPAKAVADLLSGACDIANVTTQVSDSLQELIQMNEEGTLQLHTTPGTAFEHLIFGLLPVDYDDGYQPGIDRPDYFGDVRIRQAFAYCLDRQRLVDEVFFGRSEVMAGYIPTGHPLFNTEAVAYPHDPAAGQALLDEAGWIDHDDDPSTPRVSVGMPRVPEGTPFSVLFWGFSYSARGGADQIIKESLAECGIELKVEILDGADLFDETPEGPQLGRRFELAMHGWSAGIDPPCDTWITSAIPGKIPPVVVFGWNGPNSSGYSSPEYDQACMAAMAALPGEPEYIKNHLLAQNIFARDLPVIPLYTRILVAAARPDFTGLIMDPTAGNELWNIEEFDYGS